MPEVMVQLGLIMVSRMRARRQRSKRKRMSFLRPRFEVCGMGVGTIALDVLDSGVGSVEILVPKNSSRAEWGMRKRPCLCVPRADFIFPSNKYL